MSTFNYRKAFLFLPVGVIITEGGARSKGILVYGCEAKKRKTSTLPGTFHSSVSLLPRHNPALLSLEMGVLVSDRGQLRQGSLIRKLLSKRFTYIGKEEIKYKPPHPTANSQKSTVASL